MSTEPMKSDSYAFTSSADRNYSLSVYRKFTDSPRYRSEWDESFGPRSNQIDEANPNDDSVDSPLTKRSGDTFTPEMPPLPVKTGHVRVVTPAKNALATQSNPSSVQHTFGKAELATATPIPRREEAKPMDILWAMINDITGKDKLAKFGQYSLRLLLHHARKSQTYLSDEKVNIKSISQTYASNEKVLNLLINFAYDPRSFARVVGILVCSVFSSRCAALVPAIATFRQFLRFGKSPFRARKLWLKLKENVYYDLKFKRWSLRDGLLTKAALSELISLYYSINDEALLLFKLKFLRNDTLKLIVLRHEAYAWYCDSWFALYNSFNSLLKLSQQEMETRILIQVRKRSRVLSKQILGTSSFHSVPTATDEDDIETSALNDIQFQITNAKLDILKTVSDIIFNSYTVFEMPLHFDTVQIWTGISASLLSSIKIYREKRRYLE